MVVVAITAKSRQKNRQKIIDTERPPAQDGLTVSVQKYTRSRPSIDWAIITETSKKSTSVDPAIIASLPQTRTGDLINESTPGVSRDSSDQGSTDVLTKRTAIEKPASQPAK